VVAAGKDSFPDLMLKQTELPKMTGYFCLRVGVRFQVAQNVTS
jgi:hypothetical protein